MGRNMFIVGGVAATVTAAGALLAAPAIASSALVQTGNSPHGQGQGHGQGMSGPQEGSDMGSGSGRGAGSGMGSGAGLDITNLASGTLTDQQKQTLASMAEEEKLAHDVYVTLAAKYPDDQQFARISKSETKHLEAVRALLARYQLADPTAGQAEGAFATVRFQDLYNQLTTGATTSAAALQAGVTIEQTDIADLEAAKASVTAPDVSSVYSHLITASQHHLNAFGG
ncbi:MAG: hypothetical protein RLZ55_1670 [Actinomycetota bacterium]